MKKVISASFILSAISLNAQNVGINTDGSTPGMMLDVKTTTATASDGIRINNPNAGDGDAILNFQNAGTSVWSIGFDDSDADKFKFSQSGSLGTTDYVTIETDGDVGMGTTTPSTQLHVLSNGVQDAIYGQATNVGAYLGYETNFSFGVTPQAINGSGVWAANPNAGYTSVFAQSTGSATVAANISYSSVWMPVYSLADNASAVNNSRSVYSQLNVTNSALGGVQSATQSYNIRGTTAGNPGYSTGEWAIADAQNQDAMGVWGTGYSNSAIRVGGYFEGYSYPGVNMAYAYVAGTTNGGVTLRKIVGSGSVSEIVPTANHGRVTLTCPESPEYWYQDYGTVTLVDGKAHVDIDPILTDIIIVDGDNPLRVYCTPVEMPEFNGVTIMNKTATGFDIVELNGGTHNGIIDYQLIVKPKTNFGEGRFPQAPGPGWLKADEEPASAKAANQPQTREVFHWPADWVVYGYEDLAKQRLEEMRTPANAKIEPK